MKTGLICNLANGEVGGQTTKTKEIISYLSEHLELEVYDLWPAKSKKKMIKILLDSIKMYNQTDNIVVILNTRGTQLVLTALKFAHFFKKKQIIEIAVGGTRQEKVKSSSFFRSLEKPVGKILVETSHMADEYHKMGLSQAEVLANCRKMPKEAIELLPYQKPLRMCTYSRVVEDKGVDTAVEITKCLKKAGVDCSLDIYGPIDPSYEKGFSLLLDEETKDYIKYMGVVESDKSVETLKNYHMLLFPTRHASEGFPGTFIDAMEAGLVIISSYNNNFTDIVKNEENGYLINTTDINEYVKIISSLYENEERLNELRKTSLLYSRNYSSETVLKKLVEYLQ